MAKLPGAPPLPKPPELGKSPFPPTYQYFGLPDPLASYKRAMGLLGTAYGMWGKMNKRGR